MNGVITWLPMCGPIGLCIRAAVTSSVRAEITAENERGAFRTTRRLVDTVFVKVLVDVRSSHDYIAAIIFVPAIDLALEQVFQRKVSPVNVFFKKLVTFEWAGMSFVDKALVVAGFAQHVSTR